MGGLYHLAWSAVPLRWSGQDAFDERGTRVATIARFRDLVPNSEIFVRSKPYWNAFVHHEYVLVDGERGWWATETEAKAAAEAAYRADLAAPGYRSTFGKDDNAIHHLSETGSRRRLAGFLSGVRLLFQWRSPRGSDNVRRPRR